MSNFYQNLTQNIDQNQLTWINKLPKIDLHRHLTTCITPTFISNLLFKYEPDFVAQQKITPESMFYFSNATEFFRMHSLVRSYIRDLSDFTDLAKLVLSQLQLDNIFYVELLFSPQYFIDRGFSFLAIIERLVKVFNQSTIRIKLIIEFSRGRGLPSAQNCFQQLMEILNTDKANWIAGISVGGDEINFSAKKFRELFQLARDSGLKTAAHAGEWATSSSIWEALTILQVNRIIHGIKAAHDQSLVDYLITHQIPLDISISSNYATGAVAKTKMHPVKVLNQLGCIITLSTDIPGYLGINLNSELKILYNIGFGKKDLLQILRNAIFASSMKKEEKHEFLDQLSLLPNLDP